MHSGYGRIDEILFAGIFGIIIGYIFQKTRSFPFILVIHGTANVLSVWNTAYNITMILKATIAANNTRSVLELKSRLLDTHLFQYFVSEINSADTKSKYQGNCSKGSTL